MSKETSRDLLSRRRDIENSINNITRQVNAICRKTHSSPEKQQLLTALKNQKETLTQELSTINRNIRQIKVAKARFNSKQSSEKVFF